MPTAEASVYTCPTEAMHPDWAAHAGDIQFDTVWWLQKNPEFSARLAQRTREGMPALAFNLVRKYRAHEVVPSMGYTTGFEGYLVGVGDEAAIMKHLTKLGQDLEKKIKTLPWKLRDQVLKVLRKQEYALPGVQWLSAELGAMVARLKCEKYHHATDASKIPEQKRLNEKFRAETYGLIRELPLSWQTIFTQVGKPTTVVFPLPKNARTAVEKYQSESDMYLASIGMLGLPCLRAFADLKN